MDPVNANTEQLGTVTAPSLDNVLLAGVSLTTGENVDVLVRNGRIAALGRPGTLPPAVGRLDLTGYLLLPAPAEPHVHLDKALTAAQIANPGGDLDGAIRAWVRAWPSVSREDVIRRAREAALMMLANGATAIRTHVDVGRPVGLRFLEALLEVRQTLRSQIEVQVVASAALPLSGATGSENRALLRTALETGADVVGSYPYLDSDPEACHEICLSIAADLGVPVDMHTDETIDPGVLHLPHLAELVAGGAFPHGVVASHCVSLGVQPAAIATRVAQRVASAGVAVICLPQTNLFLHGRDHPSSPPRGLTAVRTLLAAGVTVAGGGDNLQDAFNSVGRGDPLETASLLVVAAHLTPHEAYAAVSSAARAVMGLPEVRVEAGYPADLLAVRATSLPEALAAGNTDRVVIHRGRLVSRTAVTREFPLAVAHSGVAHSRS